MPVFIQDLCPVVDFYPAETAKSAALHPGGIEFWFRDGTKKFIVFIKDIIMAAAQPAPAGPAAITMISVFIFLIFFSIITPFVQVSAYDGIFHQSQ